MSVPPSPASSHSASSSPLFPWRRALETPRVRLICLPYAGGGASIFHAWMAALPADIEVLPVQFPARQTRLHEPPLRSVSGMVDALVQALSALPPAPLVLYGHSLGSLVAFELARQLRDTPAAPRALIVAARRAPQLPATREPLHTLSDAAFKDALHRLYGAPLSLLQNDDLMAIAMPALRGDFAAHDLYEPRSSPPLEIPLTVLFGTRDPSVSREASLAWREVTTRYQGLYEVDGAHLFVDTHRPWVLERVREVLSASYLR